MLGQSQSTSASVLFDLHGQMECNAAELARQLSKRSSKLREVAVREENENRTQLRKTVSAMKAELKQLNRNELT